MTLFVSYLFAKYYSKELSTLRTYQKYILVISVLFISFGSVVILVKSKSNTLVSENKLRQIAATPDPTRYTHYWLAPGLQYKNDTLAHKVLDESGNQVRRTWSPQKNVVFVALKSVIPKSTVDIPVFNYKGVNVNVNGKRVQVSESKRGTLLVPVNKSDSKVKIEFKYTLADKVSAILSSVTWIISLMYFVKESYPEK